ncbi:hypothetical protein ACO0K9_00580 [Undibacterium sp. Ji50W]|uniref:hypothetical protein n=1 Tax=Undibacterium sp. Ji50W TaxID=3413041 RepID=UPI003BEF539A
MGSLFFIGLLFTMSFCCFVIAAKGSSFWWFVGGLALLYVAVYAVKQLKKEMKTGSDDPSWKFTAIAILVVLGGVGLCYLPTLL